MSNQLTEEFLLTHNTSQLVLGCQAKRPDHSHEPYCFALFRRAIVDQDEACWAAIYEQYQKLVGSWLLELLSGRDIAQEETLEELVVEVYTAFWRAFTAEKLAQAQGLGSILSYLKACAGTTALQVLRRAKRQRVTQEWDQLTVDNQTAAQQPNRSRAATGDNPERELMHQLTAAEVWQIVDSACHDEQERLVARLSFVSNLKPNLILERHPDRFRSVEEIYTMRRNLKNRLARNAELRALWGEVDR